MSKAKGIIIQQQGKNIQTARPQQWQSTNVTKVPQLGSDEFKYGFPSDGLAVVSYKWWGSSSVGTDSGVSGSGSENHNEQERKSGPVENHGEDGDVEGLSETGNYESDADLRGAGLLSHLRKRTAEEGKEALRLGVHQGLDVSKVGEEERKLLLGIFKPSLRSNGRTGSSGS